MCSDGLVKSVGLVSVKIIPSTAGTKAGILQSVSRECRVDLDWEGENVPFSFIVTSVVGDVDPREHPLYYGRSSDEEIGSWAEWEYPPPNDEYMGPVYIKQPWIPTRKARGKRLVKDKDDGASTMCETTLASVDEVDFDVLSRRRVRLSED